MLSLRRLARVIFGASALCWSAAGCAGDRVPVGLWDATVTTTEFDAPFKFEIERSGSAVRGSFFEGDQKVSSADGRYEDGVLSLVFPQFGTKLEAKWERDRLVGMYDRGTRGPAYVFQARRAGPVQRPTGPVPSIAGEWRIPLDVQSEKGESTWRLVVRQSGAQVLAAIMRVDGDTGALTGSYREGTFVLGHFSGVGPERIEITPTDAGTLRLLRRGRTRLVAVRATDPRAQGIAAPTDPRLHTRVKDPSERFRFAFPDLQGRMVSDADPRFQGKVVIVSVTGTWCPNCHDEAPFLADLYRTHRARGLEIVALAFEEPAQLADLTRVRGFIAQYGLTYPFLLAGTPEQAPEKVPQAINLNTFPATFVLGRDGRVRSVYAGYASKATGDFHQLEQKKFLDEIERLLAEPGHADARRGLPVTHG
jgi:peroxiredoxin